MNDATSAFANADVSALPDIHRLQSDLDVALWVLLVGNEQCGLSSMSAAEVAAVATGTFRRGLSRQAAAAALTSERKLATRVSNAPAKYMILRPGIDRIAGQSSGVVMIDPTTAFSGLQKVDAMLSRLEREALICDPYVDESTLVTLSATPPSVMIRLLTQKVNDAAKFRQKLQAFQRQFGNLEVRVNGGRDLHDRYIIDSKAMWLLGTSLNYIGRKQTFIVAVGEDIRTTVEIDFRSRWVTGAVWQ